MSDWLTIQCLQAKECSLRNFIYANPILDATMKELLENHLKINSSRLQNWILAFQNSFEYKPGLGKKSQTHVHCCFHIQSRKFCFIYMYCNYESWHTNVYTAYLYAIHAITLGILLPIEDIQTFMTFVLSFFLLTRCHYS